jgi:DNA helicase-2/ATP-dependent DNA helicase PcrA
MLSLSPEIREIACSGYKHITVDEFQDVDPSQNLLLDLASEFAESIVVVGDDDQSIYQWRGADAEFLTEKLDMGGWSVFTLQSNFRCPAKVVSLAAQSIQINQDRFPKTLRGLKPRMGSISIESYKNRGEQAEKIASEVKGIRKTSPTQHDCSIAILVRSKASISSIEQRLLEHEIPYRVLGGGFWYERKIPRGFLNILLLRRLERRRLSGNFNEKLHKVYIDTLKHIANFPNRFLSGRVISTIAPSIEDSSMHLTDLLHRHWPESSKKREAVVNLLEFLDGWMTDGLSRPRDLIQAYTEIPHLLEAISTGDPESSTESALEVLSFKDFADRFSSDDELINEVIRQRRVNQSGLTSQNLDPSAIDIQTIHSSKGLAWDYVYVPDLNYTVFPWRPIAWINGRPVVGGADLEAERRLFYVAITRAKESLFLSSIINPESTHYSNQESEFIEELPTDWLSERWGYFDDAVFRVKSDPGAIQKTELEQIADELGFLPAFLKIRENALEELS